MQFLFKKETKIYGMQSTKNEKELMYNKQVQLQ